MPEVKLQNLLLCGLLIEGGAELPRDGIVHSGRRADVSLDTSRLDCRRLATKIRRLADSIEGLPDPASAEDWNWVFSNSVLGGTENHYRRLKGAVVDRRSRG